MHKNPRARLNLSISPG